MPDIEEIRRRWEGVKAEDIDIDGGCNLEWDEEQELFASAPADIHALLAAIDTLTAERDTLQAELVCAEFQHEREKDEALEQYGRMVMERDAARARAEHEQAAWKVALDCCVQERDTALARVKELEAALRPFTRILCCEYGRPMTRHERELNEAYNTVLRVLDPHGDTSTDKEAKPC